MKTLTKFPYAPLFGDYALRVIAEIIERARKDLTEHHYCASGIDRPMHSARYCAQDFLDKIDTYMIANAQADTTEIALEIVTWLQ